MRCGAANLARQRKLLNSGDFESGKISKNGLSALGRLAEKAMRQAYVDPSPRVTLREARG